MTNRLQSAFAKPHAAFVAFITAANLDALVAGGADVIALGMPFTDPIADGPAIQSKARYISGLPRRYARRNDEKLNLGGML